MGDESPRVLAVLGTVFMFAVALLTTVAIIRLMESC